MSKLLIIDKDQTLIRSRLGGEAFVQKPWDQVPIEGMAYKLNKLYQNGWRICIASNQGGIEAGKKSLESAIIEMEYCLNECFLAIDFALFCPDYEGKLCYKVNRDGSHIKYDDRSIDPDAGFISFSGKYRKPNPGMLLLAKYIYRPEQCLYVGDRPEDEAAALAANIPYLHRDDFLKADISEISSKTL